MQKTLILLGALMLLIGLVWPWISASGLGRLPGDIAIQRPGFSFFFPLTTSLLLSAVLSLVFWLVRR
jgi:hypothetical protein